LRKRNNKQICCYVHSLFVNRLYDVYGDMKKIFALFDFFDYEDYLISIDRPDLIPPDVLSPPLASRIIKSDVVEVERDKIDGKKPQEDEDSDEGELDFIPCERFK